MPTKRCVFIEKICNNSIVSPLSEIFFVLLCCKGGSEYERSRIEIDYSRKKLLNVIGKIADYGAFERFFRPEGKMNDRVCALPVLRSKLRLYCLRLSDSILILGNGGVKKTKTYNEDDALKGYVITLQRFDSLLKEGVNEDSIAVSENTIETDKTFDLIKKIDASFDEMLANTSAVVRQEVEMEFALSNRIYELMTARGLTKIQFAKALGKKPSEITKWLSGQHNFTLRTISMLSVFFGEPLIKID